MAGSKTGHCWCHKGNILNGGFGEGFTLTLVGEVWFVSVYTDALHACKRIIFVAFRLGTKEQAEGASSKALIGSQVCCFLGGVLQIFVVDSEVQGFLSPATNSSSTRWKLNEYFKLTTKVSKSRSECNQQHLRSSEFGNCCDC